MVVNNTLSEIGDILYIYSQVVVDGDVSLNNYIDEINGETPTRFFDKKFRYSKDGLNYSNWIDLTNTNIQLISGMVRGLLFLEFKYERSGIDNTGILEFLGLKVNGNVILQICNNTTTLESIFSELYNNDFYTTAVRNNLLRKIYYHGIVPKFIERGEGIDDEDYISFWGAISLFLAFVSSFSNNFDIIFFKRDLLTEYLYQQGLKFCRKEITFTDLQYLTSNLYDEIRKRGTSLTYKKKHSELLSGDFTMTDGEWMRILCRNHYDEFLLDIIEKERHGYCIGSSSPLYNGTNQSEQLNKTKENTKDFIDLNKYSLFGAYNLITDGSKKCLSISGANLSGLGFNPNNIPKITKLSNLITVDPELDYEITFDIKRKSGSGLINFGVLGYNRNGVYKENSIQNINNNSIYRDFLVMGVDELCRIQDIWYSVRGIIYAKNSQSLSIENSRLNIGFGNNLKFSSFELAEKIQIQLNSKNSDILIHNLKMRPLIRGKHILPLNGKDIKTSVNPYIKNPQFVQAPLMVLNWRKNNNESMDEKELDNFIQEFLLPYQQKLNSIPLTPKVDDKQILS